MWWKEFELVRSFIHCNIRSSAMTFSVKVLDRIVRNSVTVISAVILDCSFAIIHRPICRKNFQGIQRTWNYVRVTVNPCCFTGMCLCRNKKFHCGIEFKTWEFYHKGYLKSVFVLIA
jgi:hypothetical protein